MPHSVHGRPGPAVERARKRASASGTPLALIDDLPEALVLLVLLGACSENEIHRASATDVFFQQGNDEVDVLWVVDDSVSMSQEQDLVSAGFSRFVSAIDAAEVTMDLHVGVVTTDMDPSNPDAGRLLGTPAWLTSEEPDFAAQFRSRVIVGTEGSDKEQGLEAARVALRASGDLAATNEGFMRDGANLAIVFVSDENDCSNDGVFATEADGTVCYEHEEALVPVADYVRQFQALKGTDGQVTISGILGPDISEGCTIARPGHRYTSTADAFDGYVGDICEADFGEIMDAIGSGIVAPATAFPLSHGVLEGTLEVYVDLASIPEDPVSGWRYDAEVRTVYFDGDYVPPSGAKVEALYTIAD